MSCNDYIQHKDLPQDELHVPKTHTHPTSQITDIESYYLKLDGTNTLTGIISYDSHPVFTLDTQLVDKKYVDDVVLGEDLWDRTSGGTTLFPKNSGDNVLIARSTSTNNDYLLQAALTSDGVASGEFINGLYTSVTTNAGDVAGAILVGNRINLSGVTNGSAQVIGEFIEGTITGTNWVVGSTARLTHSGGTGNNIGYTAYMTNDTAACNLNAGFYSIINQNIAGAIAVGYIAESGGSEDALGGFALGGGTFVNGISFAFATVTDAEIIFQNSNILENTIADILLTDADIHIEKVDPELRLTDTGNDEYTRITKSDTDNVAERFNRIFSGTALDSDTKLLITMDGVNDGTTFTDNSASAHTITRSGVPVTKTAIKKFGTASGYFPGGSAELYVTRTSDFDWGTGDFTVDLWCYPTFSAGLAAANVINTYLVGAGIYIGVYSNTYEIATLIGGAWQRTSVDFTKDAWQHIAVTRDSGTLRIFKDGVKGFEGTVTADVDSTRDFYIGGWTSGLSTTRWQGYIDEVRVSKGVARWTSDFTPPTAAYGGGVYHEVSIWKSEDTAVTGEEGIQTFGDSDGRTVVDGKTIRFNIEDTQIGQWENDGTLSVDTTNYETLVTDDNDIPNKKYVDDAVLSDDLWDRSSSGILTPKNTDDSLDITVNTNTTDDQAIFAEIISSGMTGGSERISAIDVEYTTNASDVSGSEIIGIHLDNSGITNGAATSIGMRIDGTITGTQDNFGIFISKSHTGGTGQNIGVASQVVNDTNPCSYNAAYSAIVDNIVVPAAGSGCYAGLSFGANEVGALLFGFLGNFTDGVNLSALSISNADIVFQNSNILENTVADRLLTDADMHIAKVDPELRLIDTGDSRYTRITRSDTNSLANRFNQIGNTGGLSTDVKLLLHMEGANGGIIFTDSSTFGKTPSVVATATTSTDQKVFGSTSGKFTGVLGNRIQYASDPDLQVFTGDFEIEFRAWISSSMVTDAFLYETQSGIRIFMDLPSGRARVLGLAINGTTPINDDTWHTISVARVSGTTTLRVDGVTEGVPVVNASTITGTSTIRIGCRIDSQDYLNGYIDELIVSNGSAIHTTDYTPAIAPYASDTRQEVEIWGSTDTDIWFGDSDSGLATTIGGDSIKFEINTSVIGQFEADGTLSVDTASYENLVTDDNDIPNKKYVDDLATGFQVFNEEPTQISGSSVQFSTAYPYESGTLRVYLNGLKEKLIIEDSDTLFSFSQLVHGDDEIEINYTKK